MSSTGGSWRTYKQFPGSKCWQALTLSFKSKTFLRILCLNKMLQYIKIGICCSERRLSRWSIQLLGLWMRLKKEQPVSLDNVNCGSNLSISCGLLQCRFVNLSCHEHFKEKRLYLVCLFVFFPIGLSSPLRFNILTEAKIDLLIFFHNFPDCSRIWPQSELFETTSPERSGSCFYVFTVFLQSKEETLNGFKYIY